MSINAEMMQEMEGHLPFGIKAKTPADRWQWMADYLNAALLHPEVPCVCCKRAPNGEMYDHLDDAAVRAMLPKVDTGDTVWHLPSGEKWLVAFVRGDRLTWCGWPEGTAELADCRLITKATKEQRLKLLDEMAKMHGSDSRKSHAQEVLRIETAKTRCLLEWEGVNDPPCHPGDDDWRPCPLCRGPKDE